ncbi:MAG: 30S ribosomal protein S1 [Holosporaceae bacterium]|jgi:small subunit ribosomal protein S1|nr:30S ribosomal protein S1 [Holosporaceae bacterium]
MSDGLNVPQDGGFAQLFEQTCKTNSWAGKVVKGTVIDVDNNFVVVDVGLKSEGRIPLEEFAGGGRRAELNVGDKIDVFIDRYENKNGEIMLSREKAIRDAAWVDLEKAFREGISVTGTIFNRIKGGFVVDLNGVTAFLPGSQVDVRPVKDVGALFGIAQPFLILKVDKVRENIVVSRRGILEGMNAEEKAKSIANLAEGQTIDGVVKNVTNYGAFVDIGGVDGLLHNTDISWKRVNHPSEVLTPGQEIKVKVIKFNRETRRISLGLKQLTDDPWNNVDVEFKVGTRVHGRVTNVTDYGLFVELKEGVEGLVYVSEISWRKNINPSKSATVGEKIEVVVLDVDMAKRRIGLGIKQLQGNPWEQIVRDYTVGLVFESTITNVTDFGMFVRITEDIDGMVHINDLCWEGSKEEELAKYKVGGAIKVKVLEVDQEKSRISLGVKQMTPDARSVAAPDAVDVKKGSVVTCVVSAIRDGGLDVNFGDGRSGFIKKIDLAKDRQDRRMDRFAVGEKVDAKVIAIDKSKKNAELSIKALEIEEEKQAMAEFGSPDSGASLGDILGVAIGKSKKQKKDEDA